MNRFALGLLLLISFFFFSLNSFSQNCYRIKTETEIRNPINGFGFVVNESEQELYLMTARHVVIPKDTTIQVRKISVIIGGLIKSARIFKVHESEDLAIIVIEKPKGFDIGNRYQFEDVKIGESVYLAGRYGYVSRSKPGTVIDKNDHLITAKLSGVASGASGGPLLKGNWALINEKITGIIIRDDGYKVKAVPAGILKNYLDSVFIEQNAGRVRDFPVIMAGISGYGVVNESYFKTLDDYYQGSSLGYGSFIEIAAFKYFILSYQYNLTRLRYQTYLPYLDENRYKNNINTHSFTLKYTIQPVPQKINGHCFVGFSMGNIDPVISLENSDWVPLIDLGHNYSKKAYSAKAGYGLWGCIFKNFYVGIDFEFEYFFNQYVYFNSIDPYGESSLIPLSLNLKVYLGFILWPGDSNNKLLR